MLCLGIESSCDDTSLALVDEKGLLACVSAGQEPLHALFGGVVPEMASREHARHIGSLCDKLFARTGVTPSDVDITAVARGPGLLGSLLVGISFAKAFALGTGSRFIGVNHLHAHLLAVGLEREIPFPALGLLVSGGHTHIYRIEGPEEFLLLGRTLDDAAGEAFDKAGKMLGLPYPAGRVMDELANRGTADAKLFPRPYLDNDNLDFSFSGLKTAMSARLRSLGAAERFAKSGGRFSEEDAVLLQDLCASYRLAVVDTLLAKCRRALDKPEFSGTASLVLAGGVACNSFLRASFEALAVERRLPALAPSPGLCTDNGAMVAHLGRILGEAGRRHDLSVEAVPRGRAVPDDMLRE